VRRILLLMTLCFTIGIDAFCNETTNMQSAPKVNRIIDSRNAARYLKKHMSEIAEIYLVDCHGNEMQKMNINEKNETKKLISKSRLLDGISMDEAVKGIFLAFLFKNRMMVYSTFIYPGNLRVGLTTQDNEYEFGKTRCGELGLDDRDDFLYQWIGEHKNIPNE
jgi:hypothetical protein